jgi:hypothetical protein
VADIIDVILAGHARTWELFTEPDLLVASPIAHAGEAYPKGSTATHLLKLCAWE